EPLNLYVTTRTTNRKVRNLRARPEVAFVVPAPHRFFPVFPPRAIQFLGTATIGCGRRRGGNRTFEGSWFLRRILATERRIVTEGGRLCFNRIRPNRTVFTYAIGMTVWDNLRQPRGAIGRVTIPESGR
ncbi:MAG TPA: pyridoxamine 5'-phosphate oxidase, partial [Mycobacterium sp.]